MAVGSRAAAACSATATAWHAVRLRLAGPVSLAWPQVEASCRQLYTSTPAAAEAPLAAAGADSSAPGPAGTTSAAADTFPVVIAGGGPTGLTAALLLAKHGVRCLVLERSRALTDHPQAHFINMRCMEVFRGLGGE